MIDNRAIGVLDSGLGGLTAVRELMEILPNEDIIYFGDNGRVPYGTRSRQTIINYSRQDIEFLRAFDIKALVVACGTISAVALELLSGEYDMPLTGVLRCTSHSAAKATKTGRIGLIGTNATVGSGAFERMVREYAPGVEVFSAACPLFVSLVECGRFRKGDIIAEAVVADYLAPLKARNIDTLILGCTHYPLLSEVIQSFMGEDVRLINSGKEAASYISGILKMTEKLTQRQSPGRRHYYVSDSVENFAALASDYLNAKVEGSVSYAEIDENGRFSVNKQQLPKFS